MVICDMKLEVFIWNIENYIGLASNDASIMFAQTKTF